MIRVSPEPAELSASGLEDCCLCDTPTHYWYPENDVALCPQCAKTATHAKVPTKAQWVAAGAR